MAVGSRPGPVRFVPSIRVRGLIGCLHDDACQVDAGDDREAVNDRGGAGDTESVLEVHRRVVDGDRDIALAQFVVWDLGERGAMPSFVLGDL